MYRIAVFCWLFTPLLLAQDAINPCIVSGETYDCSVSGTHPAQVEVRRIKLNNKRKSSHVVPTDAALQISARLKYIQRAKAELTTTFTNSQGVADPSTCPDRVVTRRLKPPVDVSWSATMIGTTSGTQTFSGTGLEATIPAPPVTEVAVLTVSYSLSPGSAGCVTVVGSPTVAIFDLTVTDGPYLTGITATDVAGYHKRLTTVPSGTYLVRNSGEVLDFTANMAGAPPGYDEETITWSSVPTGAGSFIDGNNTGLTVRWRQQNGFVSSAADDVVLTATLPGGTPTKFFLTVVEVGGDPITLETGATETVPCLLTPAAGLSLSALTDFAGSLNSIGLTTAVRGGATDEAAILAAAAAPSVLNQYSFAATTASGTPSLEVTVEAGSSAGDYWATHQRSWEGTDVLLAARAITVEPPPPALAGEIQDGGGGSGPGTILGSGTLSLQLNLTAGSLPSGSAIDWTLSSAVPGTTFVPSVPTGANSLTADINLTGQPVGEYVVTAAFEGTDLDTFTINLEGVELGINTDDHPRVGDLPVASTAADITLADAALEDSRGGYLWVNDDNDHSASGNKIDLEDSATFVDDDLEPLSLGLPAAGLPAGHELVVSFSPGGDDLFRLWGENKDTEVEPNDYDDLADVDPDSDGLLWIEGLEPGTGTITITLNDASGNALSSDSVRLTVFGVESIAWATNGTSDIIGNPGLQPSGQTRTGVRIFPDKRTQADAAVRDQPKLVARVTPAIPAGSGWHVPVIVRVFDVDHYSKGLVGTTGANRFDEAASSVDPEGGNNGREPNDNRTGYNHDDLEGDFGDDGDAYDFGLELVPSPDITFHGSDITRRFWAHRLGEGADAEAVVHLTHHTPCNNWRAAAAIAGFGQWNADRPIRIDNAGNDGHTLEYINNDDLEIGAAAGATAARSTETLTVWRRLFMEQDVMGPVDVVNPAGGNPIYPSVHVGMITGGVNTYTVSTNIGSAPADRFEGGIAKYLDAAHAVLLTTTINGSTQGAAASFTTADKAPVGSVRIIVADDDVTGFGVDALGMPINVVTQTTPVLPNYARFNDANHFGAACIEVDFTTLNGQDSPNAPFYTMIPSESTVLGNTKTANSAVDFWVVTHLVAFESAITKSGDPDGVVGTSNIKGITDAYWSMPMPPTHGGFITFLESIRDATWSGYLTTATRTTMFPQVHTQTSLHECGHALGGRHSDGGLMAKGTSNTINTELFNGVSLRRFMLLRDVGP